LTAYGCILVATFVATLTPPDPSGVTADPNKTDDLDTGGRIWRGRIGLRALWGVFPVVVRVRSSACSAASAV
jgi:hypothetical protein